MVLWEYHQPNSHSRNSRNEENREVFFLRSLVNNNLFS